MFNNCRKQASAPANGEVDTLIGRNTRITRTDFKPKAYRFMLGDNCEVGIW